MKKSGILFLAAGLALVTAGCGYSTGGEDSTVTVIEATPTPTPEPTPEATPTPEPTATPVQETSQTAAGVTIVKQDATYYATSDVNLRTDCSTDAQIIQGVASGTALPSTGVSQDLLYQCTVCIYHSTCSSYRRNSCTINIHIAV